MTRQVKNTKKIPVNPLQWIFWPYIKWWGCHLCVDKSSRQNKWTSECLDSLKRKKKNYLEIEKAKTWVGHSKIAFALRH